MQAPPDPPAVPATDAAVEAWIRVEDYRYRRQGPAPSANRFRRGFGDNPGSAGCVGSVLISTRDSLVVVASWCDGLFSKASRAITNLQHRKTEKGEDAPHACRSLQGVKVESAASNRIIGLFAASDTRPGKRLLLL